MRISIRPHDSGYLLWRQMLAAGNTASVKFNGVPQYECVMADSEAGTIARLARDADGKLKWDFDRQCFSDEILHGHVEIDVHEKQVL